MSWFKNWFTQEGKTEKVNERVEKRKDGSSTEHFLWTHNGSKKNHSHVVVNKDPSGKITSAFSNGPKDQRK